MRCFSALLAAVIALSICPEARAEKRPALINNPSSDAAAMRASPQRPGFEVVEGRDLDRRAMDRLIQQFGVYDRCMLKPRDTQCLGINVAQK
jgi:hypothetical protein